ncbi:MAG: hypothetical protein QM652_11355 [Legionella sp.]|uniref:capsular polysaccharide export protein, LipB/KpsS family n=1 Tax=Legionella sp. TaxID=459 RepID=UPI0039E5FC80
MKDFFHSPKTTLVIRKHQSFDLNQNVLFFLGTLIFKEASFFQNKEQLISFVEQERITTILFFSPYANVMNKRVYDWIRESRCSSYVVCEKGALPDSIYLDDTGFLNDSDYYRPEYWNRPLTKEQREQIITYTNELLKSGVTREANPARTSLSQVKKELGVVANRRVLFVPFQRQKDAVIRHFCGAIKSYDCFYNAIQSFAKARSDWQVIYKNHPNEKEFLHIENGICADNYNAYDLIELCDAVALINSGLGIFSLLLGKPTYVFGDAWYAHNALTVSVNQRKTLDECLIEPFVPEREMVLRFLYYLRFSFYSFVEVNESSLSDGSSTFSVSIRELGHVPMIKPNFLGNYQKNRSVEGTINAD